MRGGSRRTSTSSCPATDCDGGRQQDVQILAGVGQWLRGQFEQRPADPSTGSGWLPTTGCSNPGRCWPMVAGPVRATPRRRRRRCGKRDGSNPGPRNRTPLHHAERRAGCTWKEPLGITKRPLWLRGQDLNLGPSGYEPDELPDCSTPRQKGITQSARPSMLPPNRSASGGPRTAACRGGATIYFFAGLATSRRMKTVSPGRMYPSSRRAISSIVAGS